MKEEYLANEFWILIFGGGFQRANIYKDKTSEKVRREFRKQLRAYIEALVEIKYITEVSEQEHITNIKGIVKFSNINLIQGKPIPINFGVAQKLLNLYLKYLWCNGKLQYTPVHFPVDRLVQEILNKEVVSIEIPKQEIKAWTKFENEKPYLEVIRFSERIRDKKYKDLPLAELELMLFSRR